VCIEELGPSAKLSFAENQEATRFIILGLPKYANRETIGRHCLDLMAAKFEDLAAYVRVGIPRRKCARHPIVSPEPVTRNCCLLSSSPKMRLDYGTRIDARRAFDVSDCQALPYRHSSNGIRAF